jgi:hypothetical protein
LLKRNGGKTDEEIEVAVAREKAEVWDPKLANRLDIVEFLENMR